MAVCSSQRFAGLRAHLTICAVGLQRGAWALTLPSTTCAHYVNLYVLGIYVIFGVLHMFSAGV